MEGIALWMADALIEAAMREGQAVARARPAPAIAPAALPKRAAQQATNLPRSPPRKRSLPSSGK